MRKFLLYSSALVLGLSGVAEAACIQTPTCSSLGYTSTSSCTGGTKCPFGNYWNCTGPNNTTEINTIKTELTEVKKTLEEVKKTVTSISCGIGSILYSDKSCSNNLIKGKTPIGIVVDNELRLAMAATPIVCEKDWSAKSINIPEITIKVEGLRDSTPVYTSTDGKNKTKIAYEACKAQNISCPAIEYAYEYKTDGTNAGDWFIPAADILSYVFTSWGTINTGYYKVNNTDMKKGYFLLPIRAGSSRAYVMNEANIPVDFALTTDTPESSNWTKFWSNGQSNGGTSLGEHRCVLLMTNY